MRGNVLCGTADGFAAQLVALITEDIDRLMAQYEESGHCCYGEYQSYEEAKWMLLMDFYKGMYSLPKDKLGNTPRPNRGIWDVVGFEKCDFCPDSVGRHCQYEGFVHYRFGYCGIQNRTPANLTKDEAHELRRMVERKESENTAVAEKLVEYGYAYKRANEYIPNVVVIRQSTNQKFLEFCERKNFSAEFIGHADARRKLHNNILNTIEKINCSVRKILYSDLPECVSTNAKPVDALLESICTTSHTLGCIVKYALASGWLKYDENTSPAIGAFFNMQ